MTLAAIWTFLKKIPDWLWYVFLIVAAGVFIDLRARDQQRKKDKAERESDAHKVDNTILGNSDAMVDQADRIRAANPVEPDSPDGVPREPIAGYHFRDR